MYTDEQFEQLEQEELEITEEELALMFALLALTKRGLEKEIRDFYSKYGKDGVVTYQEARKWVSSKDHRRRLTVMLLFINDSFNKLFDDLTPYFKTFLEKVAHKEFDFFGVDIPEEIAVVKWGADDKSWEVRLEEDVQLWNYQTQNKFRQSLLKRATLENVTEWVDDYFGYMERVLKRLGLTESTAVGSFVRQDIFKQLGITKYRFYTQADERTCEICGSMHGLIFPASAFLIGSTASPLHPNCRCFEIPIVE